MRQQNRQARIHDDKSFADHRLWFGCTYLVAFHTCGNEVRPDTCANIRLALKTQHACWKASCLNLSQCPVRVFAKRL